MSASSSRVIHAEYLRPDANGSLRMPVYDSAAFEFASADEMRKAFEGRVSRHSYTRISNPSVEDFEQKVRAITGATGVTAVASGMASISNTLVALCGSGSNVVTTKLLFGNTISLFERTLKPWGLETRYVDFDDPAAIEKLIDENTRAVFLEVISNPGLMVPDIEAISKITRARGVPLLADTTMTSLHLFDSKRFGVDIELISSTKFITGGATSIGGLIIDNGLFDWNRAPRLAPWAEKYGPFAFLQSLRKETYRNLGACLSAHNAYLQTLGLETLALRAERASANALVLAKHLESTKRVRSVNYPGLDLSPWHATAAKQFPRGCGGVLTFELGGREECFAMMDRLKMVRRAANFGDNKSLVIHPASTIFCEYPPEERVSMGAPEGLMRLSVGIEEAADLIEDIEQALAK